MIYLIKLNTILFKLYNIEFEYKLLYLLFYYLFVLINIYPLILFQNIRLTA
jgi:hypothetical protein